MSHDKCHVTSPTVFALQMRALELSVLAIIINSWYNQEPMKHTVSWAPGITYSCLWL